MHQQHWLVALAFGSHFDSPVQAELEKGINVLDSACGTLILFLMFSATTLPLQCLWYQQHDSWLTHLYYDTTKIDEGPATWAMQMAKAYPKSKVYGTDISERFPDSIKPSNCEFLVHNIVENPPFPDDHFGFIHQRFLLLGIAKKDWPQVEYRRVWSFDVLGSSDFNVVPI